MTFLDEFVALTEERHQEVLRLLDVGFWVWKPAEEEVYWSDYLFELFGTDPETFEPSFEAFAGFVHPDDREEVLSAVQEAAESGESFDIEFRYLPADTDEARWLRSRGQPDVTEDDTLRKMVGVVQDVTDLKRAEQKREETRRYLELLFDLTPLALVVSTPDGIVKEINRAFAEEFGMEVIAEGVETEKQRDRLAELGCPLAQGYLFARPMPSDQFANYIGEMAEVKR